MSTLKFRTDDQVIWLLVNRDKSNDELVELKLKCLNTADPNPIQIWHDLYHGLELDGILCDADTQTATVNIFVEAGGYGAISLTMAEALDENIKGQEISRGYYGFFNSPKNSMKEFP